MKYIFYVLSIIFCAAPSFSQTNGVEKIQKGNKTLARIPIVVSDREGRRISGLKKDDFTITKGGVSQEIAWFGTEQEPVSVALLLDTSGSTQDVLNRIKDAAKDFIDQLNSSDQCMIATFDSQINILASFTSNQQSLKDSLNKIKTADKEGTILYNAVDRITDASFSRVRGRKAIIVLSDGKDYGSTLARENLLDKLNESDVAIYPIYYQSGTGFVKPVVTETGAVVEGSTKPAVEKKDKKAPKPKKHSNVYSVLIPLPDNDYTTDEIKQLDKIETTNAIDTLRRMSELTSGRFYISDSAKLNQIFKQVATELKQEYALGFYTDQPIDQNFMRDVRVKVNRPNAVVQTRNRLGIVK